MFENLFVTLFFSIPIASIIMLIISIYRYISAKKRNKAVPNTYSEKDIKARKIMMIIMLIIVGVLATIVVGFILLLYSALAYM